jgi:hypothetical protein
MVLVDVSSFDNFLKVVKALHDIHLLITGMDVTGLDAFK